MTEHAIKIKNLKKTFKNFQLDIPDLRVPSGFTTVIAGENGSGKTTLLRLLSGLDYAYQGEITVLGVPVVPENDHVKRRVGYTGGKNYFLPHMEIREILEITRMLFPDFDEKNFHSLSDALQIADGADGDAMQKKICTLSEGTLVKLMLALTLSRQTDLLLLDEPSSALDPLMRERLDQLLRNYMMPNGHSIVLSTHNITDMENLTDYLVIMAGGKVVEDGFAEDLKEKYVSVEGDASFLPNVKDNLLSFSENRFGFTGMALKSALKDVPSGVKLSRPTLSAITLSVMQHHTHLQEVTPCD